MSKTTDVVDLACELIARVSVTPEDAGCQDLMADRLSALGFHQETLVFEDTTNMWCRKGKEAPVFACLLYTSPSPRDS